ncbi:MAG: tRNA pseudouridine(38-40) synthase TruA [Campylobacteraceae bacterium 4484_166]|nr:MAG: tRNA pseudouridine(38-40) synthase TruA [Campylobacteraceae bacterium 4484_166]
MTNIKLVFSYDGSRYYGSQIQPQKKTVAYEFEKIFKKLNINSKLILSGRTDKNVHATNQVANIFVPPFWTDMKKLFHIISTQLPKSIELKSLSEVSPTFHARFSAKKRVYRYIITQKKPSVYQEPYITYHKEQIDKNLITSSMKEFVGRYDFRNFSKDLPKEQNSIREIYEAKFYKHKDIYLFKFVANSFLRGQIRLMVALLLDISSKKANKKDIKQMLFLKTKKQLTQAPPNGLYLTKIFYKTY